jgi:hypothetical protein
MGGRLARKAGNLIATCEPIVEPRRLITLWTSPTFYRDSFIPLYEIYCVVGRMFVCNVACACVFRKAVVVGGMCCSQLIILDGY